MSAAGAAPESAQPTKKSTETLSQFVARVLDQLSLSAWLPSAALVLSVALIFNLASVLESVSGPCGPVKGAASCNASAALGEAASRMANISLGGAALILISIIVFTMLTQAFAFEAIRVLEGYWGTSAPLERLARQRCAKYRKRRITLDAAHTALLRSAWQGAREKISTEQSERVKAGKAPVVTPDMLEFFEAALHRRKATVSLSEDEKARVSGLPWERHADPDTLRRMVSVDKQRQDYPAPHRALPTRFGCVMRSHEDATGVPDLESWVQDNFDALPASLQQTHDEHRTRLDLYCSMVFVVGLVLVIGVVRMLPEHPGFAAAVAGISASTMWLSYRSAIAAARAYGSILGSLVKVIRDGPHPRPAAAVT